MYKQPLTAKVIWKLHKHQVPYRRHYTYECDTDTPVQMFVTYQNSKSFSNGVGGSAGSHRHTGDIVYSQEEGLV